MSTVLPLLAILLILFGEPAQAQDKWGPHIDFEAKPGSKRSLGEADLFLPLMQDERTLFFGNARGRFDDQSNREGNFGLGARRMYAGGWNLGGYGYFDRRRSENDHYHSQLTLGAEALGRDWDFRANVYLPQGERVRSLNSGGGASTATISGASIVVTTPGVTTSEERALKGFDVEIGGRVPLFDVDDLRQLRVYSGSYRFKDDVLAVRGSRWRAELAMAELPRLWRGAQLIGTAETQDDNARGRESFFSLRLRIPLGGGKERPRPLSFQERRMTAPVIRDADILTQSRVVAATPTLVETASALDDGRPLTVISSATTSGAGLPAAVGAAGANSTVVLSGTFNTISAIVLSPGQTLMGAGTLTVRTPSGHTANLTTPRASIAAFTVFVPAVAMDSDSVLTGLNISNTGPVFATAVGFVSAVSSNATISGNAITAIGTSGTATGISIGGGSNIVIRDNTVTAASNVGASAFSVSSVVASSFTLSGNILSGSTNHTSLQSGGSTITVLPGSTGNTVLSGACFSGGPISGSVGYTNAASCP